MPVYFLLLCLLPSSLSLNRGSMSSFLRAFCMVKDEQGENCAFANNLQSVLSFCYHFIKTLELENVY